MDRRAGIPYLGQWLERAQSSHVDGAQLVGGSLLTSGNENLNETEPASRSRLHNRHGNRPRMVQSRSHLQQVNYEISSELKTV